MNIKDVMYGIEKMRDELNVQAYETGDFRAEQSINHQIEILDSALEYLWQYGDLMDS